MYSFKRIERKSSVFVRLVQIEHQYWVAWASISVLVCQSKNWRAIFYSSAVVASFQYLRSPTEREGERREEEGGERGASVRAENHKKEWTNFIGSCHAERAVRNKLPTKQAASSSFSFLGPSQSHHPSKNFADNFCGCWENYVGATFSFFCRSCIDEKIW